MSSNLANITASLVILFCLTFFECKAADTNDKENVCLLYSSKNFSGEPLLSLNPIVKVFETRLLFHLDANRSAGIVIQSVKLTKDNCSVILCDGKHLQGKCVQLKENVEDVSSLGKGEGEENATSVYKAVRSVDCHCDFLGQDDIVRVSGSPSSADITPSEKLQEGYPPPPISQASSDICATLFRDWHFKGQPFFLEFAGSVGKIDLGLKPRIRSLSVNQGCSVNLWNSASSSVADAQKRTEGESVSFFQVNETDVHFEWACCFCDPCSESVCQNAQRSQVSMGKELSRSSSLSTDDFSQFVKYGKKIIGIGRNYRWTKVELAKVLSVPKEPIVFLKPSTSYITEGQIIKLPESLGTIFYELELGVVIGKQGKYISEADALNHVAGYFLALDMTAKEFIKRSGNQSLPWEIGKGYDSACPVGDFIPKSQLPDPNNVHLECKVNGMLTQSENTNKMIFNVQQLIAYISKYMTLEPYDVILTGTPDGFGPLKAGDFVEGKLGNVTSIQFMAAAEKK